MRYAPIALFATALAACAPLALLVEPPDGAASVIVAVYEDGDLSAYGQNAPFTFALSEEIDSGDEVFVAHYLSRSRRSTSRSNPTPVRSPRSRGARPASRSTGSWRGTGPIRSRHRSSHATDYGKD